MKGMGEGERVRKGKRKADIIFFKAVVYFTVFTGVKFIWGEIRKFLLYLDWSLEVGVFIVFTIIYQVRNCEGLLLWFL